MAHQRRSFLKAMGLVAGSYSASGIWSQFSESLSQNLPIVNDNIPLAHIVRDEDYWSAVQSAYTVGPSLINLNNGGVSPSPKIVQDAVERFNKMTNEGPSYYMWRILDQGREPLRYNLSQLAGCDPDEIAVNRNATEALNTIIYGLRLNAGDEVIGTKQDYPNMINAWRQRATREGIIYKQISFLFPIENDEEIVAAFEKAITPNTKVLHITHVINWVGQILPVKKICAMAKKHGVLTLVDGAHSFGLMDFKIPDLGCDYFGTSLHKFMSAPIGSGLLWVKKENISGIWPLICNDQPESSDIRKFESLGTRSFPIEQGIGVALDFHNAIGSKRKEERIRYLKNYWASQAKEIPKVKVHTSLLDQYSCAICGVSIDGMTPAELDGALFRDYKIHTVGIVWDNISCVRITPHVYTKITDLDKLVHALTKIAGKK
ncbi:MAG: aminotransferase class V-fold PLP-dependent enzyme [Saprospiraceae bacterium]